MLRLASGLLVAIAIAFPSAGAQDFQRGPARSPHGALSIACLSCHTSTSWAPARGLPEFNHNSETSFSLRGLHENVQCRLCHTKPVFSDAGTKCADCHADIHRRQFGARCDECHTVKGWRVGVEAIRAHQNRFPLLGAHSMAECDSCHKGGAAAQFTGLSTECATCHLTNYQQATAVNHQAAGFPLDCRQCHGFDGWHIRKFDHTQFTQFRIDGAHTSLECSACHAGGRYTGLTADCFGCHAKDFAAARSVDHVKAGFPRDCTSCHSTAGWKGAQFDHGALTKFPLTGAHVRVECASCHVGGRFAGTRAECYGCHVGNYESVKNPDHVKSGFPTDCASCHTTGTWLNATFNHSLARFPLTGAHTQVSCTQCHVGGQYTGISYQCSNCHLPNFQKTTNPNHVTAGFPQDCSLCHTTAQWAGAKFDHGTKTTFPLTGSHVPLSCAQCHTSGQFTGLSTQCAACHLPKYQKTTNPNHVAAGLPQDCSLCHTTVQWAGAKFDHGKTKFALTGSHVPLSCTQCHSSGQYAGLSTQCASCHLPNYQKTTNPNHVTAGFPQDCAACHTTTQWTGATFNHTTKTTFPLTGAHVPLTCNLCHSSGVYDGLSTQCVSCHLPKYQKTTNPNHVTAGFPQDCAACHTTTQWTGATFNHTTKTTFPLTGAHVPLTCNLCHASGVYAGLSTQCVSCHLPKYQKTTSPNHVAAGFPQDCAACHTTTQWTGATFDHSVKTRFPLTGAHVQVACNLCHASGVYAGLSRACVSCHLSNYQKTTNPNHVTSGFPQDCAACHTTTQWTGATFNHATQTTFPLSGAHVQATCTQCHSSGVYKGLAKTCVSCHLAKYQATTNPKHSAAGFPQDCSVCHSTTNWLGATFNHSTLPFPLVGKHVGLACTSCHASGVYVGLATTCVSCHLARFQSTTNPSHTTAGFPQTCDLCHTPTGWTPSSFNHATTRFPLTGRHTSVACASCHVGGKYAGTAMDCYSCHRTVYSTTTNPNHTAAGFPTTCQTCHTTTSWAGATFNHTWFPSSHHGAAGVCSTCHTNASDYKVFTCTGCHAKASTESKHSGRNGYVYNSANCYACHPRGSGG